MSTERRYNSPEAARRAVIDKLRAEAATSAWRLGDLQRQYAYDQLVERLYRLDEAWVIKGATALLARKVSVRHTVDIDLYRAGAIDEVERRLREAADLDIDDWMRFEIGPAVKVIASGAQACRVKARSFIGTKLWAAFQIDIVADGVLITGSADSAPPLTEVHITDRQRMTWRVYPLVDHVADKVCAILERHTDHPSTRFKDLIDVVAISRHATVKADRQQQAMATEAARRNLELPTTFDVPDHRLWERGYRAEARRTVGLDAITLEMALTAVRPFLNPVLDGTATGTWDPNTQTWT